MSTYMKIDGINGGVSAAGFTNAIQLSSIDESVKRFVSPMVAGRGSDRESSGVTYQEMEIAKPVDEASVKLYSHAHKQDAISEVKIAVTRTGSDNPEPFLEYELSNVLISSIRTITPPKGKPVELITLNFTKMQKRVTPSSANNAAGTPSAAGYDIATAQVS